MQLEPVPQHGVSGFSTTGTTGDYQFQFHDHVDLRILDPAASRYSLQQRGGSKEIVKVGHDFNPDFNNPATIYTVPEPNPGPYTAEPEFVELEKLQFKHASKIKSHQLQRSKKYGIMQSYMENKLYEGFGQHDPQIQQMLRDPGTDTDYIPSAFQPKKNKHTPFQIKPGVRQNEHQGTHNPVYAIGGVITPNGNSELTTINNQHTTEADNDANAAAGTAESHAESMVHTFVTNPTYGLDASIQKVSDYNVQGLDAPPLPDIRPSGYIVPLAEKTVQEHAGTKLQVRHL